MLCAVPADFLYVFRKSSQLDVCVCGHAMTCHVMSRQAMSCNAMTCDGRLHCSIICVMNIHDTISYYVALCCVACAVI